MLCKTLFAAAVLAPLALAVPAPHNDKPDSYKKDDYSHKDTVSIQPLSVSMHR